MQNLTYLLLGVRDSLSLDWLRSILFYSHPKTGELHPESKKLLDSVYRTLVQVMLIYILLPLIFDYLSSYSSLIKIFYYYSMGMVTILTYGYTFFYFTDVFDAATVIVKWNRKVSRDIEVPFAYGELEDVEKVGIMRGASNKIKSFIFLACYFAFYFVAMMVLIHIPYLGRLNLVLSEGFFNGIFYFIRKWPYDDFNIGFFEKNWAYLTGFGLSVSIFCNYIFQDNTLLSNGAYFVLTPYLIINMIVSSPPTINVKSFRDMINVLGKKRNELDNSYNRHRDNLRDSEEYQKKVIEDIVVLRPVRKATTFLQGKLERLQQAK